MRKTIICNIPMKEKVDQTVYLSDDRSVPVSERAVRFPINTFLEKTMKDSDELKVVMLIKRSKYDFSTRNAEYFKNELENINSLIGAKIEYKMIESEFTQKASVHKKLVSQIVDELDFEDNLYIDITYGSKDLPIVIFTALNYAEKFMGCNIENILYGQASFDGDKVVDTKIYDMIPLYCISSITNTIDIEPDKAKDMLKVIVSH